MQHLLKEFEQMPKLPLFEINLKDFYEDYIEDEYEIFNICADETGLHIYHTDIFVEWDECFSLDEHIQALYEQLIETLLQYNDMEKNQL